MRRLIVVLLGPAGSGKSTQGELLAKRFGFERVSTGDMLRAEVERGTDLGLTVIGPLLKASQIIPAPIIDPLLLARLAILPPPSQHRGYLTHGTILDGYPRLLSQVGVLDAYADRRVYAICLNVSSEVATRRLLDRKDNRDDDTPEGIAERLRLYRENVQPILNHYKRYGRLHMVDGEADADTVANHMNSAMEAIFTSEDIYQA